MIFAKEERLAHRLEDNKNNKIDTLKNELSERLKELSLKEPEEQQAYINNLYRGLSQQPYEPPVKRNAGQPKRMEKEP